jgi:hypothetical protein
MPFLYMCSDCFNRDQKSGLLISQTGDKHIRNCPYCGQFTAKFQRAYKNKVGQIKQAVTFDVAQKKSDRASRRGRASANEMSNLGQMAVDETELGDSEYVPQVDFKPNMRFTDASGPSMTQRVPSAVTGLVQTAFEMVSPAHTITTKAGRADTGTVMASALTSSKPRTLAAYTWANWGSVSPARGMPYNKNKYCSLEWCHLVADSLGGPTTSDNLVAASYAANTFMMTIEEKLNAKSTLSIQVKADCSTDHVAEFIYYTVNKGNSNKTWTIDARNDYFTKADYETVGKSVTDFIK